MQEQLLQRESELTNLHLGGTSPFTPAQIPGTPPSPFNPSNAATEHAKQLKQWLDETQHQLMLTQSDLVQRESEIKHLKQEVQKMKGVIDLHQQPAGVASVNKILSGVSKGLPYEQRALQDQCQQLTAELAQTQDQVRLKDSELAAAQKAVNDMHDQLATECSFLRAQCDSARSERDSARTELRSMQAEFELLQGQWSAVAEQLDMAAADQERAKAELESQRAVSASAAEELAVVKRQLQSLQDQQQQQQQQLQQNEQQPQHNVHIAKPDQYQQHSSTCMHEDQHTADSSTDHPKSEELLKATTQSAALQLELQDTQQRLACLLQLVRSSALQLNPGFEGYISEQHTGPDTVVLRDGLQGLAAPTGFSKGLTRDAAAVSAADDAADLGALMALVSGLEARYCGAARLQELLISGKQLTCLLEGALHEVHLLKGSPCDSCPKFIQGEIRESTPQVAGNVSAPNGVVGVSQDTVSSRGPLQDVQAANAGGTPEISAGHLGGADLGEVADYSTPADNGSYASPGGTDFATPAVVSHGIPPDTEYATPAQHTSSYASEEDFFNFATSRETAQQATPETSPAIMTPSSSLPYQATPGGALFHDAFGSLFIIPHQERERTSNQLAQDVAGSSTAEEYMYSNNPGTGVDFNWSDPLGEAGGIRSREVSRGGGFEGLDDAWWNTPSVVDPVGEIPSFLLKQS